MTSEQHRLYGRHSNIPECCVEAFVALVERHGLNAHTPAPFPTGAQYRSCEKCFLSKATPAPLHICDESCREFLLTVMPEWQVNLKLASTADLNNRFRGVLFEFDYGPAPGIRPFRHLAEDELATIGEDWDLLEAEYAAEESTEEGDET